MGRGAVAHREGEQVTTFTEPTREAIRRIAQAAGVRPLRTMRPYADLLTGQFYYFHLLLQVGDAEVAAGREQR